MNEISNQNGDILNFVLPKDQSSYIKVIGVGGGGGNAVNHMYRAGIKGVDFIVCNTDAQALEGSPVPTKIHMGKGLGAGNVPEVARTAAEEKRNEIREKIQGARMLFIAAGMGGGTGTGAAPVVASIAKEIELKDDEVTSILTVAIVTTPFTFEGRKRIEQAKVGIDALRKQVDAILVINNDKLREFGKMTLNEAFSMADDVLTTAAKSIAEIITVRSYVQIDFKDVNTVMQKSGVALMGFGSADGEDRAKEAVAMAMESPLLNDNSIKGAKNMLLYFGYSPENPLCMDEIETITTSILEKAGEGADLIWGAGEDSSLGGKLNVTLIATGFAERRVFNEHTTIRIPLEESEHKAVAPTTHAVEMIATQPAEEVHKAPVAPVVHEVMQEPQAEKRVVATLDASNGAETPLLNFELPHHNNETVVAPAAQAVEETPAATITEEADGWFAQFSGKSEEVVEEKAEADLFSTIEQPTEQVKFHLNGAESVTEQAPAVEVAVQSPVNQTTHTTVNNSLLVGRCAATSDRVQRLKEFSGYMSSPQGLRRMEETPAYMRQNITLDPVVPSSVSEVNRNTINKDGSVNYNTPPFLTDQAD